MAGDPTIAPAGPCLAVTITCAPHGNDAEANDMRAEGSTKADADGIEAAFTWEAVLQRDIGLKPRHLSNMKATFAGQLGADPAGYPPIAPTGPAS